MLASLRVVAVLVIVAVAVCNVDAIAPSFVEEEFDVSPIDLSPVQHAVRYRAGVALPLILPMRKRDNTDGSKLEKRMGKGKKGDKMKMKIKDGKIKIKGGLKVQPINTVPKASSVGHRLVSGLKAIVHPPPRYGKRALDEAEGAVLQRRGSSKLKIKTKKGKVKIKGGLKDKVGPGGPNLGQKIRSNIQTAIHSSLRGHVLKRALIDMVLDADVPLTKRTKRMSEQKIKLGSHAQQVRNSLQASFPRRALDQVEVEVGMSLFKRMGKKNKEKSKAKETKVPSSAKGKSKGKPALKVASATGQKPVKKGLKSKYTKRALIDDTERDGNVMRRRSVIMPVFGANGIAFHSIRRDVDVADSKVLSLSKRSPARRRQSLTNAVLNGITTGLRARPANVRVRVIQPQQRVVQAQAGEGMM